MSETTGSSDLTSMGEDALAMVNEYKRKLEEMTRENEMLKKEKSERVEKLKKPRNSTKKKIAITLPDGVGESLKHYVKKKVYTSFKYTSENLFLKKPNVVSDAFKYVGINGPELQARYHESVEMVIRDRIDELRTQALPKMKQAVAKSKYGWSGWEMFGYCGLQQVSPFHLPYQNQNL
jgi:Sec-independent protein translocase protein TatA